MKKKILFLIPILFLGLNSLNLLFYSGFYNKKVNLKQNNEIIALSLGNRHSGTIIDTDLDGYADTLYMWGDNSFGQIGDEKSESIVLSPKIITPQEQNNWGGNIIDIDLGGNYTGIIIDTDLDGYADTLYMWGDNSFGQLGDETTINKSIPIKITPQGQNNWDGNIINLSLGMYCSGVSVDTDLDGYADTLYMWGNNNFGQIGDEKSESIILSPKIITPRGQDNWEGNIIDLSLGGNHSGITIDTDLDGYADTLYMWGYNYWGQLGDGTISDKFTPTKITPEKKDNWSGNIINLDLSLTHSGITIDTDLDGYADTLYMWGNNSSGQIGDGTTANKTIPTIITPNGKSNWGGNLIDLSLGENHSGVIIDNDLNGYGDTLYTWGSNKHGQIGNKTSENKILYPKIIASKEQTNLNENIINLSLGIDHTGVIIDLNKDGYGDTIYMWGKNDCGQIGNGNKDDQYYPNIIISNHNFMINNLNFYNNNNVEINLTLNDYQNIINEAPEVILIDNENNSYTANFINGKSEINDDQYYYQVNNTLSGENYNFTDIFINNDDFSLDQEEIKTDYLISDYTLISSTEETEIIDLNLDQNSNDFDINNYTEDQRKIQVNYFDIDNEISNSQEFILDENYEITLINLKAETNYRINSINYFYENGDYKYKIEQDAKIFQTTATIPSINVDSISLIENSITTNSFEYTIEIDNLKKVEDSGDNFTQYDINNGIWLIDQNDQTYNSSFINERRISNGTINGTQNYEITFLQENLLLGETYSFNGIGFNNPNGLNPDTIYFSSPFEITTINVNKKFENNTFQINPNLITSNSFEYNIVIDNLILIDDSEEKPTFLNFNLDEPLWLKDQKNENHSSQYINNTTLYQGIGEKEGTVKYQFSFKVSCLNSNTTYNFISLSFTESFNESIDISENGIGKTSNYSSEKIVIWVIITILIMFILITLSLIWANLLINKKIKNN